MKKIFAVMALALALTTVMAAITVVRYTDQAAACAPGQVC
jgi:FtsH-binding integral membrane protein